MRLCVCPLICKPSPEITSSSRLSRSYCLHLSLIAVCVENFGALSLMEIDFVAENEKVTIRLISSCVVVDSFIVAQKYMKLT